MLLKSSNHTITAEQQNERTTPDYMHANVLASDNRRTEDYDVNLDVVKDESKM